ncbi:MAG: phosphate signaling complex protein PhoU [Chlorobiaceae bacterium]|nr:phosphate signaling complex protein PhoU [Chlorobiaceae bacterium]NTV59761.1 phosphate signaling complex protein PhoU [Chlorobiaceae bacterium]
MSERPVHDRIRELSDTLVELAANARGNLLEALEALKTLDSRKARRVKTFGYDIGEAETRLESQCLSFLALQQPVAKDFRTIVAIMKINEDIERIGDLSVHIVERVPDIGREMLQAYDLEMVGEKVADMLQDAIDAFAERDALKAGRVNVIEEEIDSMHSTIVRNVIDAMKASSRDVEQLVAVLSISRSLERIADHATRISREVVYLVTGETPRQMDSAYEFLLKSLRN